LRNDSACIAWTTFCRGNGTLASSDEIEFLLTDESQWYIRCWVASDAQKLRSTTSSPPTRMATKSSTSCMHHSCPLTHQLRLIQKAFKLVGHHPSGGGGTANGHRRMRKPQLAHKSKPFKQTTAHHTEAQTTGSMSAAAPRTVQVRVAIHRSCGNLLYMHTCLIDWASTLEVYRNLVMTVFTRTMLL
jgi:hypothetical protein